MLGMVGSASGAVPLAVMFPGRVPVVVPGGVVLKAGALPSVTAAAPSVAVGVTAVEPSTAAAAATSLVGTEAVLAVGGSALVSSEAAEKVAVPQRLQVVLQ